MAGVVVEMSTGKPHFTACDYQVKAKVNVC